MGGGHGGWGGGHGGWGGGHGGWGHSGWYGHRGFFGPRFVVGGGFLYGSPFFGWPYYWGYPYGAYPYPYPYPYGGYGYGYPPPYDAGAPDYPPPGTQAPAPDQSSIPPAAAQLPSDQPGLAAEADAAADDDSSYGLIQLRGVPESATVDLDGRRWLDGRNLSGRWLALPAGFHTIAVRADGYEEYEQRIDVAAGRNRVVTVGPLRPRRG